MKISLELAQDLGMVPKPPEEPKRRYWFWQLILGQALRDDERHREEYNRESKRIAAEYADELGLVTVRSHDYVRGWMDCLERRGAKP